MTRDDVIAMARAAGMERDGNAFYSPSQADMDVSLSDLERFASLVEQRTIERCAAVCDQIEEGGYPDGSLAAGLAWECAAAIRAQGGE